MMDSLVLEEKPRHVSRDLVYTIFDETNIQSMPFSECYVFKKEFEEIR